MIQRVSNLQGELRSHAAFFPHADVLLDLSVQVPSRQTADVAVATAVSIEANDAAPELGEDRAGLAEHVHPVRSVRANGSGRTVESDDLTRVAIVRAAPAGKLRTEERLLRLRAKGGAAVRYFTEGLVRGTSFRRDHADGCSALRGK